MGTARRLVSQPPPAPRRRPPRVTGRCPICWVRVHFFLSTRRQISPSTRFPRSRLRVTPDAHGRTWPQASSGCAGVKCLDGLLRLSCRLQCSRPPSASSQSLKLSPARAHPSVLLGLRRHQTSPDRGDSNARSQVRICRPNLNGTAMPQAEWLIGRTCQPCRNARAVHTPVHTRGRTLERGRRAPTGGLLPIVRGRPSSGAVAVSRRAGACPPDRAAPSTLRWLKP